MDVDGVHAPGDTTIHINARTGQSTKINPDGSITAGDANAKPRQPRGKASFDENLADDPEIRDLLPMIANRLLEGIENDIRSRADWLETAKKGLDLMGVKYEKASVEISVDGTMSVIKHVGLKVACLTSWANSRAELLPVGGPVKVRDDSDTEDEETNAVSGAAGIGHNGGPPMGAPDMTNVVPGPGAPPMAQPGGLAPTGAPQPPPALPKLQPGQIGATEKRIDLANALERDFNHYLTVTDKEYYPDTSRMLMSRGLLGCQFKKIYNDPLLRRPVSRWVKGTNLIVSNEASSLQGAARITEEIPMRQSIAKRMVACGQWRDVQLVIPTTTTPEMDKAIANNQGIQTGSIRTEDQLHTIYECYCELDDGKLSKDEKGKEVGFPLPYRVTMDKESRVIVEIRRDWKIAKDEEDQLYERRRHYVKFGHVPSLGFYDWGFVHLIGDPQRGATMIEQSLITAGMLASFPGGVMAKSPGSRQRTTQIRPGLGEFAVIDTGGLPISDFVTTWPYKEPSGVLQAMGQDLAGQMQQVAGVVSLPVGEGRIGNTPVGTIMAYIESVTKVPSAVHKDDHIAQQEEFELLKDLFADDPEALVRGRKKPAYKWKVREEIADQDLVPAADPNVPSQTHRLMQVQQLGNLAAQQNFAGIADQRAVWEMSIRTLGFSNTGEFTMPVQAAAPPPPPPQVIAAQIKAKAQGDSDQVKAALQAKDLAAKSDQARIESADKQADRESEIERAAIKAHSDNAATAAATLQHGAGLVADHAQHLNEMGQQSAQMDQDHLHHINDKIEAAQQTEAQAQAAQQPDPLSPPST